MLVANFPIQTLGLTPIGLRTPCICAVKLISTSKAIKSRCLHTEKTL
jgi:hypothetical protein